MIRYRFDTVDLVLRSDGEAVTAAARAVFDHLGVPEGRTPAPSQVALDLSVGTDGLTVPDGAREIESADTFVRAWTAPSVLFLTADIPGGRSVLKLDAGAGRGEGRFHPALLERPREMTWHTFSLLVSALHVLLRPHGLYPLHAAALGRGGAGVLLVADSDCGKSTLAYSLVREGWSALSDDTILLSEEDEAIDAVPFRRHFGLDTVAAGFFPELASGPRLPLAEEDKWVVDVDRRFPGQISDRLRPEIIVLPEITDADESSIVAVGVTDAHHALVRQSTLPYWEPDAAKKQLGALARLVGQTRHYRFLGGRDILRRPARASELLAPLLS